MDLILLAKWAIGVIAAAIAGGFAYKRVITNKSKSSFNIVSQKNNRAGGDIIAGNSVKNSNK
jgi:hypothetical protein